MLVNCNSCLKKFEVPDSAITESGRLLQCGSCGNKWTQFPIEEKLIENIKQTIPIKIKKESSNVKKIKKPIKKKKREINLYSEEYLKKKHGLVIKENDNNKKIDNKKNQISFSFYNYLLTLSIFFVTLFGILNLTKDILISNYPFTEYYIIYFYEIFDFMKIIIVNLVN